MKYKLSSKDFRLTSKGSLPSTTVVVMKRFKEFAPGEATSFSVSFLQRFISRLLSRETKDFLNSLHEGSAEIATNTFDCVCADFEKMFDPHQSNSIELSEVLRNEPLLLSSIRTFEKYVAHLHEGDARHNCTSSVQA